jgi:hypothetical protein
LIIFTDGQDTVGGADLAAIIAQCKRDKVTAHAIGLRTSDLDAEVAIGNPHNISGRNLGLEKSLAMLAPEC